MISVVMATFNGGRYLQEQLQSIIGQSRKPDEIVICDDGSTDNTADVVDTIKKKTDVPICFYLNQTHLGYSRNFQQAINKASGDLIFLCDQDDIWIKNKIEVCVDVFNKKRNVLSLSTGFYLIRETPASTKIRVHNRAAVPNKITWKRFIRHPKYPGMAMAFRKELWPAVNRLDWGTGAAHDWLINQCAAAKDGMYYINRKLVFYRQHGNNTVGLLKNEPEGKLVTARLNIIDGLIAGLKAVRPDDSGRQRYIKRMLAFQEKRKEMLQNRRIFWLLLYEVRRLDCISVKSICGDLYALLKGREGKACAESGSS